MATSQAKPRRALRLPQVKQKTGMGRTQIFDAVARGNFPAPFTILPGGRAIGWDESEIDAFLERQMAARANHSGSPKGKAPMSALPGARSSS
jgi:prophage regulatory protein